MPAQPWHKLPAAERSRILDAAQLGLQEQGLDAVVVVAREAEVLLKMSSAEGAAGPNSEEEIPRMLLLGFASMTQETALHALRSGPLSAVTDVHEVVTVADARTPPGQAVRDACRQCWTRCHGSPATTLPAGDVDRIRGVIAAAMRDEAPATYGLRLVRRREVWVGCTGVTEMKGVQIEGFAPAFLREKLGPFAPLAVAVEWYTGPWQGAAMCLRHHSGWQRSDLPEPPLRLVPPPQNIKAWLEGQERILSSLDLTAERSVCSSVDWHKGSKVLCDSPKIEVFPDFLSDEECNHFLRIALRFQQPAAGESSVTAVPLPGRFADETLEAVEARMAAALGLEAHAVDPKLGIVWEEKGAGQYVRRNACGSKVQAVRGKMVAWLSAGAGGELRFPWAGPGGSGSSPGSDAASSPHREQQRLLAAAEADGVLTVAPRRGTAVALTVLDREGRDDERSWHVQQAWAERGAWTLQKLWLTHVAGS